MSIKTPMVRDGLVTISNSYLKTFRACKRKAYHAYVQGYRPKFESNTPIQWGTEFHRLIEYEGEPIDVPQDDRRAIAEQISTLAAYRAYKAKWGEEAECVQQKELWAKKLVSHPVTGKRISVSMLGVLDSLRVYDKDFQWGDTRLEAGTYIGEIKTKSSFSDATIRGIVDNTQNYLYPRLVDENIKGILYDLIKRPSVKPNLIKMPQTDLGFGDMKRSAEAALANGDYSEVAYIAGLSAPRHKQKKSESGEEFATRRASIGQEMIDNMEQVGEVDTSEFLKTVESFYQGETMMRVFVPLDDIRADLYAETVHDESIETIDRLHKSSSSDRPEKHWPMSWGDACSMYGRECEYYSVCMSCENIDSLGMYKKKSEEITSLELRAIARAAKGKNNE